MSSTQLHFPGSIPVSFRWAETNAYMHACVCTNATKCVPVCVMMCMHAFACINSHIHRHAPVK